MRSGTFIIPACLALALSLGCATTRPVAQQVDDSNLTASLGNKYAADPEIDRYRIDIDVVNGVVTLRGEVADTEQRTDAERIARSTEGVVEVVNKLDIDPEVRKAGTSFEDAWITVRINSKLSVDPEVHSRNVDIDVHKGIVTLSGIVENQAASAEAEDLARSVDGVSRVVNELQVGG